MEQSPEPPTTEAQIEEILLRAKLEERRHSSLGGSRQIWIASIISLVFYGLTWHKFGFSWANQSLFGAVLCIIPLAIGNPWKWLFHRNDPDFEVSLSSQIASWLLLFLSLLLCYYFSPNSLTTSLQSVGGGSSSLPTLQQAQQLNGEINQN